MHGNFISIGGSTPDAAVCLLKDILPETSDLSILAFFTKSRLFLPVAAMV
jgi:hypothetical protein